MSHINMYPAYRVVRKTIGTGRLVDVVQSGMTLDGAHALAHRLAARRHLDEPVIRIQPDEPERYRRTR